MLVAAAVSLSVAVGTIGAAVSVGGTGNGVTVSVGSSASGLTGAVVGTLALVGDTGGGGAGVRVRVAVGGCTRVVGVAVEAAVEVGTRVPVCVLTAVLVGLIVRVAVAVEGRSGIGVLIGPACMKAAGTTAMGSETSVLRHSQTIGRA